MDLACLHDLLKDELDARNRESLTRVHAIERRVLDGELLTGADLQTINDAIESATSTLAVGEFDRAEVILARRILVSCTAIRTHSIINDHRCQSVGAPTNP
ncbi:hypothetical protein [Thiocystis violacea]|uniref:hypothetical protein n=1 Tax=Thiocystis violacea TaxID=13725 RepID=UPI00190477AB|nr:hypothetical protein [Thiocystis violacea]MBK1723848.1 hypothetical protein [Thiocystis violacea]